MAVKNRKRIVEFADKQLTSRSPRTRKIAKELGQMDRMIASTFVCTSYEVIIG